METLLKVILPYITRLKFIQGHRRTLAETSGIFGGLGLFLTAVTQDPPNLDAAGLGLMTFAGAVWAVGQRFKGDIKKDELEKTEAAKS